MGMKKTLSHLFKKYCQYFRHQAWSIHNTTTNSVHKQKFHLHKAEEFTKHTMVKIKPANLIISWLLLPTVHLHRVLKMLQTTFPMTQLIAPFTGPSMWLKCHFWSCIKGEWLCGWYAFGISWSRKGKDKCYLLSIPLVYVYNNLSITVFLFL